MYLNIGMVVFGAIAVFLVGYLAGFTVCEKQNNNSAPLTPKESYEYDPGFYSNAWQNRDLNDSRTTKFFGKIRKWFGRDGS